jgi:hypothetical protein
LAGKLENNLVGLEYWESENLMDYIFDNIWLGSWKDCHVCKANSIESRWKIFSVADDAQVVGDYHFPITDGGNKETDKKYLKEAIETVDIHRDAGIQNVLVHCQSGVNRAPSVVIGVLIKVRGMSYIEAFDFVRSKRRHIWPIYQQALNVCEVTGTEPPSEEWKGEGHEYTEAEKSVNHLYHEYFKREADPDGLKYYSEQLVTGRIDEAKLRKILMNSDEYRKKNQC